MEPGHEASLPRGAERLGLEEGGGDRLVDAQFREALLVELGQFLRVLPPDQSLASAAVLIAGGIGTTAFAAMPPAASIFPISSSDVRRTGLEVYGSTTSFCAQRRAATETPR